MAITPDATSSGSTGTGTLTVAHTNSGNDNRYMFVGIFGSVGADNVTGCTYAGTPMTLLQKVLVPADRYIYLFGLGNPATGTNNWVASSSSNGMGGYGSSYYGLDATTSIRTSSTNTASGASSISATLNSLETADWTMGYFKDGAGGGQTAGANTFKRAGGTDSDGFYDSNQDVGGTSYTMNVSRVGNTNWGAVFAAVIGEGGGGDANNNNLLLLNVG